MNTYLRYQLNKLKELLKQCAVAASYAIHR